MVKYKVLKCKRHCPPPIPPGLSLRFPPGKAEHPLGTLSSLSSGGVEHKALSSSRVMLDTIIEQTVPLSPVQIFPEGELCSTFLLVCGALSFLGKP